MWDLSAFKVSHFTSKFITPAASCNIQAAPWDSGSVDLANQRWANVLPRCRLGDVVAKQTFKKKNSNYDCHFWSQNHLEGVVTFDQKWSNGFWWPFDPMSSILNGTIIDHNHLFPSQLVHFKSRTWHKLPQSLRLQSHPPSTRHTLSWVPFTADLVFRLTDLGPPKRR